MAVPPVIAVVAAGAMGAAVGARLTQAGCTVLTTLAGRSAATQARALKAGMEDASLSEMSRRARWVLSIVPPKDALAFAQAYREASVSGSDGVFVDCNAVSPQSVKRIAELFAGTGTAFVDASIIGGPPSADGSSNPTFYASVDEKDANVLDGFVELEKWGLKISPLKGDGAGIGDASALKMSYAGITKGTTALFTTMILAAQAASPATASALLNELNASAPAFLQRITRSVPSMLPKAYRWAPEMEEIASFVGREEGRIYEGAAKVYERVDRSLTGDGEDVAVLKAFVEQAKATLDKGV
ncbi:hypothetical protein PLICRDRAFT_103424 [Plicaturopsis crispa FD-325 SS-3]|nr:hypothetical protein PLICRDRAFT_103424 [Plicaturopsis crispa FD-325 SS-3]